MAADSRLTFAVIATFHSRHENTFPLLHRLLVDGLRKPDEVWIMCEDRDDGLNVDTALRDLCALKLIDGWPTVHALIDPTPRDASGDYAVIPYSNKINHALDLSEADAIVYLDNNSMPSPEKYAVMCLALEAHPDWGAVYCTQRRTGFNEAVEPAQEVVLDAFCRLNYTQVMHRKTEDRWTLDMQYADPDLADAYFWRSLHASLGPFFPAGGLMIHDTHHIPAPAMTT